LLPVFPFLRFIFDVGSNAIYLVPVGSRLSADEYGSKARTLLVETGIISVETDRFGLFFNGDRSAEAFQIEPDDELPFDDGVLFSGPHFTFVPLEYVDGIVCPRCEADITEQWAEAVMDKEGYRGKHDLSEVWISCPKCCCVYRIHEVKGDNDDKFYLTDRYVCFYDARWPKAEWLAEFDKHMGCCHEVFEYGWT
jgi:hypothetical protein